MTKETVLQEAQRLVHGDRNSSYGHPLDNHSTTAAMMTAFLRRKYNLDDTLTLDAEDVCMFNVLQKCSRQANAPKRDNLVDIAGYVANIEMTEDEKARRENPQQEMPLAPGSVQFLP